MANNTNNSSTEDQIFGKTKSKDTVEVERVVSALIERLGFHDEKQKGGPRKSSTACARSGGRRLMTLKTKSTANLR